MRKIHTLPSVLVALAVLVPAATRAQGFSFCDDLNDLVNAASQKFRGVGTDAMAAAENAASIGPAAADLRIAAYGNFRWATKNPE